MVCRGRKLPCNFFFGSSVLDAYTCRLISQARLLQLLFTDTRDILDKSSSFIHLVSIVAPLDSYDDFQDEQLSLNPFKSVTIRPVLKVSSSIGGFLSINHHYITRQKKTVMAAIEIIEMPENTTSKYGVLILATTPPLFPDARLSPSLALLLPSSFIRQLRTRERCSTFIRTPRCTSPMATACR